MSIVQFWQENSWWFIITATLFGLMVGSFLNVVIHRLPIMLENGWRAECASLQQELNHSSDPQQTANTDPTLQPPVETASAQPYNLWRPRSCCPHCNAPILAHQNIPLFSYLWQKGRCRQCQARISIRYPIVELLGGLIALVAAISFGPSGKMLFACLFMWMLLVLTCIDLDTYLLPDQVTLPLLWLGLIANLSGLFVPLPEAVVGAIAGYLSLWLVYWLFLLLTGKEGMGYGDFKLLSAMGAWLGWKMLFSIILLSSLVGSVIGIALVLGKGRNWSRPIPFGPYLATAGVIVFFWGEALNNIFFSNY